MESEKKVLSQVDPKENRHTFHFQNGEKKNSRVLGYGSRLRVAEACERAVRADNAVALPWRAFRPATASRALYTMY